MKKLTEAEIIRIMREEWAAKVAMLSETVEATLKAKIDGEEKTVIDPDLKLRHKKSQYLYTVVSVGPRDAILMTPEGKEFLIDKSTLESEYELD
jgi:NADH dehydrogenase FAD-containing subunit